MNAQRLIRDAQAHEETGRAWQSVLEALTKAARGADGITAEVFAQEIARATDIRDEMMRGAAECFAEARAAQLEAFRTAAERTAKALDGQSL